MNFVQLNELIPVITPLGKGYCIFIKTGEHDDFWKVALTDGSVVDFPQEKICLQRSYSLGRITNKEMKRILDEKNTYYKRRKIRKRW